MDEKILNRDASLDGSVSFWRKQTSLSALSALKEDLTVDVCVIGAGISGVTCAYRLQQQGLSVAIVEDGLIGSGETSRTSAHLTYVLDDRFFELEKLFGQEKAKLALQSHAAAIDYIEKNTQTEEIDCAFERVPAYLFAPPEDSPDILRQEYEAAIRLGLSNVTWVEKAPFSSFDTGKALKFSRQAQFYPLRYLNGLLEAFLKKGGQAFTSTRAKEIKGGKACLISTANGYKIDAQQIIVATNAPINSRFVMPLKQAAYRTYMLAGLVPEHYLEKALYYDTPDPYHYIRLAQQEDGCWLIVGGEDHRTGQNDPQASYRKLEQWVQKKFPAMKIQYRWSGQILEPDDCLAFIGRAPFEKNVYLTTGDSGNGLTHGTIAGMLISDLITGTENLWEKLYDPSRFTMKALPDFLKENGNTSLQYGDWLSFKDPSIESIVPGEGAVIRNGMHKIAAYKDLSGKTHCFSAVCPHLFGVVRWNSAEKSWDCPCHGSRFNAMGKLINGPANQGLKPYEGSA